MSLKDLGRRRFVAVTLNRVTEHDHPPQCYGCARPFGVDQAQPPLLHGYVTTTPYRRDDVRPGARLYWVCAPCFDEFKERLKFSTLPTVALDDLRRGPPMGPELG
jgi:hypothetical protein